MTTIGPNTQIKKDDSIFQLAKTATPYVAGAGICYATSKGVDRFVGSVAKSGDQSNAKRFIDFIDKHTQPKPDGLLARLKNGIINKHNAVKSPLYKEASSLLSAKLHPTLEEELLNEIKSIKSNGTSLSAKQAAKITRLESKLKLLEYASTKSPMANNTARGVLGVSKFLGGKIGILMGAFSLGETIKTVSNAKEGEKTAALTEDIAGNWIGMFAMFPFYDRIAAKLGNLRFLGVDEATKAKISNLETALPTINKTKLTFFEKIKGFFGFGNTEKVLAKKEVRALLKNSSAKGFLAKSLQFIGKIFGGVAKRNKIARFALAIFVLTPLVSGALKKVSHIFFGKPSPKEEEDKKTDEQSIDMFQSRKPQNLPLLAPELEKAIARAEAAGRDAENSLK